ncbi:MAG: hypothetical protein ABIR83_07175 [Nakamurella sp.]
MELAEMFDYIADLVAGAAERPGGDDEEAFELRKLALVSRARLVLDIIEGQTVHNLRTTIPQTSYTEIGDAQGISKQASRIRHTKLEQVLKVHQLDGRRHAMAKAVVSAKHRRAARPLRRARRHAP